MTDAYHPDWLPTMPTDAPDFEGTYQRTFPAQWPRGLRAEGTEVELDRAAMGVVMSWGAKARWLLARMYMPQNDSAGLFLAFWEGCFRLVQVATTAARVARIVAKARNRGTATEAVLKSIFAQAFGTDDTSKVLFAAPSADDIGTLAAPAGDRVWLDAYTMHIYSDGCTLDEDLGEALLRACTPSGYRWTIGSTRPLLAGMPINRGVVVSL